MFADFLVWSMVNRIGSGMRLKVAGGTENQTRKKAASVRKLHRQLNRAFTVHSTSASSEIGPLHLAILTSIMERALRWVYVAQRRSGEIER